MRIYTMYSDVVVYLTTDPHHQSPAEAPRPGFRTVLNALSNPEDEGWIVKTSTGHLLTTAGGAGSLRAALAYLQGDDSVLEDASE